MGKKKVTLEGLAAMVKRGFDDIGGRMATKDELKIVYAELERMNAGIHDIKVTIGLSL